MLGTIFNSKRRLYPRKLTKSGHLSGSSGLSREAIQSLERENEELMKDNTLAGSMQNQSQVEDFLILCSVFVYHLSVDITNIC